jgi:Ca2+-binding RTX toxin-like protein
MTPHGKILGTLLVTCLSLVAMALPQSALAGLRCQLNPAAGILSISVTGETIAELRRAGDGIRVVDDLRPKRNCGAGATVTNTDQIKLFAGGEASADIELSGGPFAPGLTPEEDGAPEIEWDISGPGLVEMIGTPKSDHFQFMGSGSESGVNLNADADKDLDLVTAIDPEDETVFALSGGAGADRIDAVGHPALEAFAIGGAGNDTLIATPSGSILDGGPGADRLIGSHTGDLIAPGPGPDLVQGGGGPDDVMLTRDRSRDRVNCGSGSDLAFGADRFDRLTACERR